MTWAHIVTHWSQIMLEASARWGLDEENASLWETHSWPWMRRRIIASAIAVMGG